MKMMIALLEDLYEVGFLSKYIQYKEKLRSMLNLKKMKPYLKHRLKRGREWAEYEVQASKGMGIDHQIRKVRLERE
ncbi:hypothetical protein BHL47_19730 [Bacillus cereus]|uniref:hypothetical protein n=1 Tax=Bacillus cereus TaxID=1396 RepID=UPI000994F64E|nr:hypothetical protein [Bacillus cereus]OPA28158.1 hypothetical protein BHL47_19730 [Bacillus cereus]